MNFTKSPSLLLFVGVGVYVLVDAFARAVIMGNLTCHSDSRLSLSSSMIIDPLQCMVMRSAVKVTVHPALHKSEMDSSESDNSSSSKICATSALSRFGRCREPTLCE